MESRSPLSAPASRITHRVPARVLRVTIALLGFAFAARLLVDP